MMTQNFHSDRERNDLSVARGEKRGQIKTLQEAVISIRSCFPDDSDAREIALSIKEQTENFPEHARREKAIDLLSANEFSLEEDKIRAIRAELEKFSDSNMNEYITNEIILKKGIVFGGAMKESALLALALVATDHALALIKIDNILHNTESIEYFRSEEIDNEDRGKVIADLAKHVDTEVIFDALLTKARYGCLVPEVLLALSKTTVADYQSRIISAFVAFAGGSENVLAVYLPLALNPKNSKMAKALLQSAARILESNTEPRFKTVICYALGLLPGEQGLELLLKQMRRKDANWESRRAAAIAVADKSLDEEIAQQVDQSLLPYLTTGRFGPFRSRFYAERSTGSARRDSFGYALTATATDPFHLQTRLAAIFALKDRHPKQAAEAVPSLFHALRQHKGVFADKGEFDNEQLFKDIGDAWINRSKWGAS